MTTHSSVFFYYIFGENPTMIKGKITRCKLILQKLLR